MINRRKTLQAATALAAPWVLRHARAASVARVGIPLPLTGVQKEVASELKEGYKLAFDRSRRRGGIEILPLWQDDRSDAALTSSFVESFGKDKAVLACSGIVGTPHAKAALPAAANYGLPVIGLRSGANELRDGRKGVYHLRASFGDELRMMVRMISSIGLKLGVVYSNDAFGAGSIGHIQSIAPSMGLNLGKVVSADRNGADIEAKVASVVDIKEGSSALLLLMIANPMQRGLKYAREKLQYPNPAFCMSFCANRYLAESGDAHMAGLGFASAFPLPRIAMSGAANAFREEAVLAGSPETVNSLTSLEGFMYGSVLASAIERAQQPTRAAVMHALEAPLTIGGDVVKFDSRLVGYEYLRILHKSRDGKLRG